MGTKQTNNATATQQLPVVTEKVEEATSDDVKDIEQEMVSHLQWSSFFPYLTPDSRWSNLISS